MCSFGGQPHQTVSVCLATTLGCPTAFGLDHGWPSNYLFVRSTMSNIGKTETPYRRACDDGESMICNVRNTCFCLFLFDGLSTLAFASKASCAVTYPYVPRPDSFLVFFAVLIWWMPFRHSTCQGPRTRRSLRGKGHRGRRFLCRRRGRRLR